MTPYTPGPWEVSVWPRGTPDEGEPSGVIHVDDYGEHDDVVICDIPRWIGARGEQRANARLIAASPDLLEALQDMENDDGAIPEHVWRRVQDAIAKATGEPVEGEEVGDE